MKLDETLADHGLDGYAVITGPSVDTDAYYLTQFAVPAATRGYMVLRTLDETALLAFVEEYANAAQESAEVDAVRGRSDYDFGERADEVGFQKAYVEMFGAFLDEFGVERVGIPEDFPHFFGRGLSDVGYDVEVVWAALEEDRCVKSEREISNVETAQRAAEAAMKRAEGLLRDASVRDETLHHEGEVLTAERVRTAIRKELLDHQCTHAGVPTVAPAEQSAKVSSRREGPILAGKPVLIDISPQHQSMYHGDLSRTFVPGEPTDEFRDMYDTTLAAQEAAFELLRDGPGVTGEAVHEAVCGVFEEAGYETASRGESIESGYKFPASGHSVGLDPTEFPPNIRAGGRQLEPGHVITLEPGLYDPVEGGVRIEDIVVITEDGFRNLTSYEKTLVV